MWRLRGIHAVEPSKHILSGHADATDNPLCSLWLPHGAQSTDLERVELRRQNIKQGGQAQWPMKRHLPWLREAIAYPNAGCTCQCASHSTPFGGCRITESHVDARNCRCKPLLHDHTYHSACWMHCAKRLNSRAVGKLGLFVSMST